MSSIGQASEQKKVAMGSFSFIYDKASDVLQIQIFNQGTQEYDSLLQLDASGNVKITGTLTQSATLTNYGRG
jgi:hypothetical protein